MNRGFYGLPVGEKYIERPFGMGNFEERKCPTELPYWAPSDWRLVRLVSLIQGSQDPYVLYNRWGDMLYVWDQEYPPSYVEVMQVCTQLLSKGSHSSENG